MAPFDFDFNQLGAEEPLAVKDNDVVVPLNPFCKINTQQFRLKKSQKLIVMA